MFLRKRGCFWTCKSCGMREKTQFITCLTLAEWNFECSLSTRATCWRHKSGTDSVDIICHKSLWWQLENSLFILLQLSVQLITDFLPQFDMPVDQLCSLMFTAIPTYLLFCLKTVEQREENCPWLISEKSDHENILVIFP